MAPDSSHESDSDGSERKRAAKRILESLSDILGNLGRLKSQSQRVGALMAKRPAASVVNIETKIESAYRALAGENPRRTVRESHVTTAAQRLGDREPVTQCLFELRAAKGKLQTLTFDNSRNPAVAIAGPTRAARSQKQSTLGDVRDVIDAVERAGLA